MTSSETPIDDPEDGRADAGAAAVAVEAAPLPKARAVGAKPIPSWIFPLAVIPPGWFFIFSTVKWHFTPSAVLLMICWVAIVTIGYFGIRMALSAASPEDRAWFAARGQREELEREKRGLLKAIKEIEFDRETGKLSAEDAATLTTVYRARAIEVIKAIEAETGTATSVREQLLAEVRARQAVDHKVKHAKNKKKAKQSVKTSGAAAVKSDEGEAS